MTDTDISETGRKDGKMVEEDHPQTRHAEPNARGSSAWNEDVIPPEGERGEEDKDNPTVSELAEEAAETRRKAIGADSAKHAFGSDTAADE